MTIYEARRTVVCRLEFDQEALVNRNAHKKSLVPIKVYFAMNWLLGVCVRFGMMVVQIDMMTNDVESFKCSCVALLVELLP